MNKKNKNEPRSQEINKNKFNKPEVILFIIGVALLILGFIVLSMANKMANNWAGFASPALLLAGWVLIAIGLWKGEK